jgi:hypothetical protein
MRTGISVSWSMACPSRPTEKGSELNRSPLFWRRGTGIVSDETRRNEMRCDEGIDKATTLYTLPSDSTSLVSLAVWRWFVHSTHHHRIGLLSESPAGSLVDLHLLPQQPHTL